MKKFRLFFIVSSLTALSFADIVFRPASAASSNQLDAPIYRFESNTVWGRLDFLVRDFQGHFQIECKSSVSVYGWLLRDEKTNHVIAKKNLNPTNSFKAEIALPFQSGYRLTAFVMVDREQAPIAIRLSPQTSLGSKLGTSASDSYEDFQEDPTRPYNKMVKNLYDQSVQAYSKGDSKNAASLLNQAQELDPQQPQVQTLIKKLKMTPDNNQRNQIINESSEKWKSGDRDGALAELGDYLYQHPNDQEVQNLKNRISENRSPAISDAQNKKPNAVEKTSRSLNATISKLEKALKNNDVDSAQKNLKRIRQTTPTDPRLDHWEEQVSALAHPDSTDLQAKADQTYNLGLESYRNEDYAGAKKFWEETLRIDPHHLQAKRNLERLKSDHPNLP